LAAQSLLRRYSAKGLPENAQNKARNTQWEEVPSDPRPPWVYSTSVGLRLILIPSIIFYAIFFADFGDQEHVFMPPRRWLQRQREAFFAITPEERRLVEESVASWTHDETSK